MGRSFKLRYSYLLIFFALIYLGNIKNSYAKVSKKELSIKVGVYNNSPLLMIDNKKPQGIFIDIIEYIADKSELDIEYVVGDWPSLYSNLKNGDIDILPCIAYTKERDSIFSLNELPILTSWFEIFSTKGIPFNSILDLNNKKVGILKHSIIESYIENNLKNDYGINYETKPFVTYKDAIRLLEEGKIDCLVEDRFFSFSKEYSRIIEPTGISFKPINIHFAFARNSNTDNLVEIFDKNISEIRNNPDSIYYRSYNRWLGEYISNYFSPYLLWLIYITLIGITITLLFIAILKYKVNKRTRELHLSNQALIKATKAAQESNKFKSAFLRNISHEIRTPMNGIMGFVNLLEDSDIDEETSKEYIKVINRCSERLMNTVNEIIEISNIETCTQKTNISNVNIEKLLEHIVNFYNPLASEKSLILRLSDIYTLGERAIIKADNEKLRDILNSLINNAIKFTAEGSIEIGNCLKESHLVFFVKDTGIGIPEDRKDRIFDSFIQANQNLTRGHVGVGLGLTIAKAKVEVMGGEIWVESIENKGSTFYFSVPYISVKKGKKENTNPILAEL